MVPLFTLKSTFKPEALSSLISTSVSVVILVTSNVAVALDELKSPSTPANVALTSKLPICVAGIVNENLPSAPVFTS